MHALSSVRGEPSPQGGGRPHRQRLTVVAIAALLALVASACGSGGSSSEKTDTYKLGALLDLTGSYAALGEDNQRSIKMFVKNINKNGGINGHDVEIVYADTQSSESESVNQLRKLATQDNVIGVVGPAASGEAIALQPITESLRVPVMSMGSSDLIITPAEKAKWIFKQYPSAGDSLRAQLEYAKAQKWNNVAILAANNGYGQEATQKLPDLLDEFGMNLAASETFPPESTNVASQLQAVESKKPDVILVWAVNPANAVVAKSAESIGVDIPLFNAPGGATPLYAESAGTAAEGTLVQGSMIGVPDEIDPSSPQYEVIREFVDLWEAELGRTPNQFESNAWDGIRLVAEALDKGDVDPSGDVTKVRAALRDSLETNIKDVPSVNAIYTFTADHHGPRGIKGLGVLAIQDGKFILKQAY